MRSHKKQKKPQKKKKGLTFFKKKEGNRAETISGVRLGWKKEGNTKKKKQGKR